jgi:hypothetical protein
MIIYNQGVFWVTYGAPEGSYVLGMQNQATDAGTPMYVYQTIAVSPGDFVLTYMCARRDDDGGATVAASVIEGADVAGTNVLVSANTGNPSLSYTEHRLSFTTTADYVTIKFLQETDTVDATAFIDAVSLEIPAPAPVPAPTSSPVPSPTSGPTTPLPTSGPSGTAASTPRAL